MFKKVNLLLLSFLFTVNSVSAGLVDNNERLKALLEKAKAREAGTTVTSTPATSPVPPTTINPKPIQTLPVNNSIPEFKPVQTSSPSVTQPSEVSRERTSLQSRAEKSETVSPAPEPIRAPRILSTHPVQETKPVEKPVAKAPESTPQAGSSQAPKIEIKQETKVIQPPVGTLINPQPAPIKTDTTTNSQIKQTAKEENNLINDKTNTVTSKNSSANNYDDVLKSIDAIMKGSKAEEIKAPLTPPSKPNPSTAAELPNFENKNNQAPNPEPVASSAPQTNSNKAAESKPSLPLIPSTPVPIAEKSATADAAPSTAAPAAGTKEADYLLVLNKSLKSLEQDSWINVKTNMQEAVSYFEKEKKLNPKNPKLAIYTKIILGFQRFGEAGVELDQGDLADFEEAEALYLDCQDNLEEANKELTLANDPSDQQVKTIISKVLQYTEEELNYIEEMLGM